MRRAERGGESGSREHQQGAYVDPWIMVLYVEKESALRRLQVAMDDAALVRGVERFGNLPADNELVGQEHRGLVEETGTHWVPDARALCNPRERRESDAPAAPRMFADAQRDRIYASRVRGSGVWTARPSDRQGSSGPRNSAQSDCLLPHDEPGAPAGTLMSFMAPDLLSPGSA